MQFSGGAIGASDEPDFALTYLMDFSDAPYQLINNAFQDYIGAMATSRFSSPFSKGLPT